MTQIGDLLKQNYSVTFSYVCMEIPHVRVVMNCEEIVLLESF